MPRIPPDLSNTFSVNSLGCSDKLVLIHPDHSRTSVLSIDYSFQQTKRGLIGVGHFYVIEISRFEYFEHSVYLPQEEALEGKHLIQAEGCDLIPVQAVQVYKELSEVERAFRQLKNVIDLRLIYHQTD
jgi:transposase